MLTRLENRIDKESSQLDYDWEQLEQKNHCLEESEKTLASLKSLCKQAGALMTVDSNAFNDHTKESVTKLCSKINFQGPELCTLAELLNISLKDEFDEVHDTEVLLSLFTLASKGGLAKNKHWKAHMKKCSDDGFFHANCTNSISLTRVMYNGSMSLETAKVYVALIFDLEGWEKDRPSPQHRLQMKRNKFNGGSPWTILPVAEEPMTPTPSTPASDASAGHQGGPSPPSDGSATRKLFGRYPQGFQPRQQPNPMVFQQQQAGIRSVSPGTTTTPVQQQSIWHPDSGSFSGRDDNGSASRPPRPTSCSRRRRSKGRHPTSRTHAAALQGHQAAPSNEPQGHQGAPSPGESFQARCTNGDVDSSLIPEYCSLLHTIQARIAN